MINIGITLLSIGGVGAVFAALNLYSKNNSLKHIIDLKDHDLDEAHRYLAIKREKNKQLSKIYNVAIEQQKEYQNEITDLKRELDRIKGRLWDCEEAEKGLAQKECEVTNFRNSIKGLQEMLEVEKNKVSELEDQSNKLSETLQGILGMNREDRRMFAKSGLIPVDIIKIDLDTEV